MFDDSSVGRVAREVFRRIEGAPAGTRLPSTRVLVDELGVSATTVAQAVARLVADGAVVTRPGRGSFTAPRRRSVARDTTWQEVTLGASPVQTAGLPEALGTVDPDVLQMSAAYLGAELRPDHRLSAALARAARRPDVWARPPVAGVPELRSWFAAQVGGQPDEVLVTPGGQGAVSAIMRAIVPAGEPVLFATPTYPGAVAIARSAGLTPVPVPTDGDGVRPELLERALQLSGARLVYLQPAYANPDGSVLAAERRGEVLELARRFGAFILEDDWARWLGHGTPPPPALSRDDEHGHVLTVSSLTKATGPGLRIGAILARGPVAERVMGMRLVDDLFVSGPLQHAAVEIVTAPAWSSHLRALGAGLASRCATLAAALAAELPDCRFTPPRGGVSLWLELPEGIDETDAARAALAEGVTVVPGRHYTLGEQARAHLRLSFASLTEAQIVTAVGRLARALDPLRS
ncbi:PLP-dependent aminotransferase family protein [Rhodococcus sp. X156]|uniref:aminotransferase-like domain-containing protein n=1 Tax=Rhodococcus sp. X156 TaxID=2499145 RepID=UPI000FDBD48F|nr:PLP-dependent aminotransferase family protein [Rhodococcus sp. X156]